MRKETSSSKASAATLPSGYAGIRGGIVELLDAARHAAARSVNSLMTASYWDPSRAERQSASGRWRATDRAAFMGLTGQFSRGFSRQNLQQMRSFFLAWPIGQTVSGQSPMSMAREDVSGARASYAPPVSGHRCCRASRSWRLEELAPHFTLPWSACVRVLAVKGSSTRRFL